MNFGQRLKELRLEKRMTQEDLGKLMHVSKASVSLYEKNERTPDKDTLIETADYFEVSLDFLLGRSDVRHADSKKAPVDIKDDSAMLMFDGMPVSKDDIDTFADIITAARARRAREKGDSDD